MTKRLVDIDDAILEEVRSALGTTTLKDTVNGSLHATAQAYRRSKSLRKTSPGSLSWPRISVILRSWRSRA
jgi:Arc/MetJ family transcription regulator